MRRLITQVVLFSLILVLCQSGIYYFFKGEFLPHSCMAALESNPRALVFGDSVFAVSENASDATESIPGLIQQRLPDQRVYAIAHPAYDTVMFEDYIDHFLREKKPIPFVVIPINMRTFSRVWDQPRYQFRREKIFLRYDSLPYRIFSKSLAVLHTFHSNTLTQDEYLQLPIYDGSAYAGRLREFRPPSSNFTDADEKKAVIFYFMADVSPDHPRLLALRRLVEKIKASGGVPYLYVTPLDYQCCERAIGPRFDVQLKKNVAVVAQVAREQGLELHDWSTDFDSSYFHGPLSGPHICDEHVAMPGKIALAERIANAIQKFFAA